jgi:uncharacterized protein
MTLARWQSWDGPDAGLEHLEIRLDGDHVLAEGVVIGSLDGERFGLDYRLVLDRAWRVREAGLRTTAGRVLQLTGDGTGLWTVNGHVDESLRGCIDLDIQATPFTNTLPVRRLTWSPGRAATIEVAYIDVPSLKVEPSPQRYTALVPGSRYRFEALDTGFTADLSVDAEGLVLDYPGLFRRCSI